MLTGAEDSQGWGISEGDRAVSCVWGSSMGLDAMTPINLKDSVLLSYIEGNKFGDFLLLYASFNCVCKKLTTRKFFPDYENTRPP